MFYFALLRRVRSIVKNMPVRLFVCLCGRTSIFLGMLSMALAWSSYGSVVSLLHVMYFRFCGWRHVFT